MANISICLKKILSAVHGKDVRQAIHDAIYQCYRDGKAGEEDLIAREQIATGLVTESGRVDSLDAVKNLIAATIPTMTPNTIKRLSLTLDTDYLRCSAIVTIHVGYDCDGAGAMSAEMLAADGARLILTGLADGDISVSDSWTLGEWEWDNPPMVAGVSYRTTERYQGQPVYAVLVHFDRVDGSSGTQTFNQEHITLDSAPAAVIGLSGVVWTTDPDFDVAHQPSQYGGFTANYDADDGKLYVDYVVTDEPLRGYADVLVKYVKE